jgi:hypothetical protein
MDEYQVGCEVIEMYQRRIGNADGILGSKKEDIK